MEAEDPDRRLEHALAVAYRYLAFRDRTAAEMRRHLEQKLVAPATTEAALAELERLGYVDDARFAQRYAQDRRTLDSWGADRIERKLAAAGIDPELIAAALAEQDGEAELGAAVEVLRQRLRVVPTNERERERALGLLVRRGYELELAYDAIRAFTRDAA